MAGEYHDHASQMRDRLNAISPSLCLAKWQQVSIHLPSGLTQSCYHPPTHVIPLDELKANPSALHNTTIKIHERKQMLAGERPPGCAYCWKIEDAGDHLSDRHYRSSEWWAAPNFDENVTGPIGTDVVPRYVEVNFNQACNFKCMYCSPHLSTAWQDEIEKFGPYKMRTGNHNNIEALQAKGLMPLKVAQADNPYVTAFWEWWPTIYRKLKVFRMTGGEPLMDKNTFKVLDYVNENPNGQLELSITTNFCPPDQKLFDKFITKVKALEEVRVWEDLDNYNENSKNHWYVAPAHKHFMVFVSLDGYGKQAEYMRTGMDFDVLMQNVRTYLRETKFSSISFINTFTLLSIPSLRKFLEMVLELRKEFGGRVQEEYVIQPRESHGIKHPSVTIKKHQRVWFDIPILRYPPWFSIQNAGKWGIDEVKDCLAYMEANVQREDYAETFEGFKPYELLKVKRDLAIMEQTLSPEQIATNKTSFYEFITEYDNRRNTEFMEVFPEMRKYYIECMKTLTKG
jgi:sulfatase maturation enzyme AslB (radical SAM superfamily)